MSGIWRAVVFIGMAIGTSMAFTAPNAQKAFPNPSLARIIFFHLPCAFGTIVFLSIAAVAAARYLKRREPGLDKRSEAAYEMALVLGLLTLATGILFSRVQWGAWWQWDQRQTSFLVVMLMVLAYFALRSGFADPRKQADAAAAYAMASLLPIVFLVFVYPRLPQVRSSSFHPEVVQSGGFDRAHWTVILINFVFITSFALLCYRARVRAADIESELEQRHAELADRHRPAATGVVRPVSLPPEG